MEQATLGGGCFWCIEAVFKRLNGVQSVESGYSGGNVKDPTYEQVCTGTTGHAEVALITYDPSRISYDDLLRTFWKAHDPTTLNRQGADAGTQYRSIILAHNDDQLARAMRSREIAQRGFADPIVTEIVRRDVFYAAEKYHQNYYDNNSAAPYCMFIIRPKLKKLNLDR